MIQVGYLNAHGLTRAKHFCCVSLLDSGLFDILFISEHWFVRSFDYMQHPYSFIESTFVHPTKGTGHSSAGILVMIHPRVLNSIHSYSISRHFISLKVESFSILAVYLPPSLSPLELSSIMDTFPPHDILIGDINCRFHGLTSSGRFSPDALQDLWTRYRQKFNLLVPAINSLPQALSQREFDMLASTDCDFLRNAMNGMASHDIDLFPSFELDHLFVNDPDLAVHLYDVKFLQFPTDHQYIIHVSLNSQRSSPAQQDPESETGRYYVKRLEKESVLSQFKEEWNTLAERNRVHYCETTDVDELNRMLTEMVQNISETVLGSYKVNQKKSRPDHTVSELSNAVTSVAAIQLFKRHLRSQTNRNHLTPISEDGDIMEECVTRFKSHFFDPKLPSDNRHEPSLESPSSIIPLFDSQVMHDFISKYPLDKACGHDSIHTILLRALIDTSFIEFLRHLFLACLNANATPEEWNRSIVYLIPKSKEAPHTANTVRPISVLPIFRRIFESLLIPVFTDTKYFHARLHACQAGFRTGYSTITNVAICHHLLSQKLARIAVFLDFKAAYDAIKPHQVMAALRKRKTPKILQNLIQSLMFSNGQFTLLVNGVPAPPTSRNQGLPQGSPLSPIIFNMFIDSLVRQLNVIPSSTPSCLFYADDGVLFTQNERDMRRLLNVAEKWSRDQEMTYNVSKCGVLNKLQDTVELYLQHELIPVLEVYKYLGFPMTSDGIQYKQHMSNQAETVKQFLKFVQLNSSSWSPNVRLVIYRTFLRPQMEYGAPLMHCFRQITGGIKLYVDLHEAQKSALAWVLNTSIVHYKVNQGILGVLPVDERFSHLRTMFQEHIRSLHQSNPLKVLLESQQNWKPNVLLRHLLGDSRYQQYLAEVYEPSPNALQAFLLSLRRDYIYQKGDILVNYVLPSARNRSLVDKVLYAPAKCQKEFISWRCGRLFMRNKCICGGQWNRKHLSHLPDILQRLSPKLRRLWTIEHQKMSTNYSIIDFLLNHQEWELTHSILNHYRFVLQHKPMSSPDGLEIIF